MTIHTIIFDLNDTLVVGLTGIGPQLEPLLHAPADEIPSLFREDPMLDFLLGHCTEDEYLAEIKAMHGWDADIQDIKPILREHFKQAIPGMPEIVAALAKTYPLVLLSDQGREWGEYVEDIHPFIRLIPRRFYSYQMHRRKTDPATFAGVVNEIGAAPADCLMIDDRQGFLDFAAEAGLQTILFEGSGPLRDQLTSLGIIA
jgi:FMN phosphatase YigB (HAD superfamily)